MEEREVQRLLDEIRSLKYEMIARANLQDAVIEHLRVRNKGCIRLAEVYMSRDKYERYIKALDLHKFEEK